MFVELQLLLVKLDKSKRKLTACLHHVQPTCNESNCFFTSSTTPYSQQCADTNETEIIHISLKKPRCTRSAENYDSIWPSGTARPHFISTIRSKSTSKIINECPNKPPVQSTSAQTSQPMCLMWPVAPKGQVLAVLYIHNFAKISLAGTSSATRQIQGSITFRNAIHSLLLIARRYYARKRFARIFAWRAENTTREIVGSRNCARVRMRIGVTRCVYVCGWVTARERVGSVIHREGICYAALAGENRSDASHARLSPGRSRFLRDFFFSSSMRMLMCNENLFR